MNFQTGFLVFMILGSGIVFLAVLRILFSKKTHGEAGRSSRIEEQAGIERIKKITSRSKRSVKNKQREEISTLLFRAGYYSEKDRASYEKSRIFFVLTVPFLVTGLVVVAVGSSPVYIVSGVVFGILCGLQLPISKLNKAIASRDEEIEYFLPLVIEEMSISTSSGLEPGTCISHIISLSNMRNSNNAVVDLLVHTIRLVRSGMSLEGALLSVGEASGNTEVQNVFALLAQSMKYGGEISKQFQDLSDSVAMSKQQKVERKISTLAVKATFPLFLVFAGFLGMMMSGVGLNLLELFKKMNN